MSKARRKIAKTKPTKAKAPKKPTKKAARKKIVKTQPNKAKKVTRKKITKTKPKEAKKKKAAKKVTKKKVAKTKPKKATKKKTAKKAAKPKAKTKVKSSKKKTTIKKADDFDALEHLVSREDKRLGVKVPRVRKPVSVDNIDDFSQALDVRDLRMIYSLRQQRARRGEMVGRIESFTDRVKRSLGDQISISVYLSDYDQVCMRTAFKPKKDQHPLDGDPAVGDAFKTSGLSKLMSLDGTGTMIRGEKAGIRDHDFSENKWEYVELKAAVA